MQHDRFAEKHSDYRQFCSIDVNRLEISMFDGWSLNESRICGKGFGLGLFPSESRQSQLYEFIEIAHMDHTMVWKMTVEIFVRIVWTVFAIKIKKSKKTVFWPFLG